MTRWAEPRQALPALAAAGRRAVVQAGESNHDDRITIDEILKAVNNVLNDCR